jgi:HSP20 family protein
MANMTRYDPFTDVFDDFFKGFFVQPVSGNRNFEGREQAEQVRRARIDVTELDGAYKVLAELPGVKKEDIKVQIEGDQVSVSAEIRSEHDVKEGERVLHSERYTGKIARTLRLGQEVDEAKANAKYENGILELVLPKKETAKAKQITVQ